ncbi:MAG: hypothetical protein HY066_13145 [Betaproteobacteria bacterium]|nr:hypothetical protein [Betaproteobacteria bacterium]
MQNQYQKDAWPQGDPLDRALSASLRAPALPTGFHEALRTAIEREIGQGILVRRSALESDHLQRLAELRAGYVRVRRHMLALALAVAFTVGASATVAIPWLATAIGSDVATLAMWFATAIGIGIGAIASFQKFGFHSDFANL